MKIFVTSKVSNTQDILYWTQRRMETEKWDIDKNILLNVSLMLSIFALGLMFAVTNYIFIATGLIGKVWNLRQESKNVDLISFYACMVGTLSLSQHSLTMAPLLLLPLGIYSYRATLVPLVELVKVSSATSVLIMMVSTVVSHSFGNFRALQVSLLIYNISISDKCTTKDARYLLLYKMLLNMGATSPCLQKYLKSPFSYFKTTENSKCYHVEPCLGLRAKTRLPKKILTVVLLSKWMDSQVNKLAGLDPVMTLLFGWLHTLGFYPPFIKPIAGVVTAARGKRRANMDVEKLAEWAVNKQNYVKTHDGVIRTLFLLYRQRFDKMSKKERKLAYQFSNIPNFRLTKAKVNALKMKILKTSSYLPAVFDINYKPYTSMVKVRIEKEYIKTPLTKEAERAWSSFRGCYTDDTKRVLIKETVLTQSGSCFFKMKSDITKKENFKEMRKKARSLTFLHSTKTMMTRNTNCVYRRKFKMQKKTVQDADLKSTFNKKIDPSKLRHFTKPLMMTQKVTCENIDTMRKVDYFHASLNYKLQEQAYYCNSSPNMVCDALKFVEGIRNLQKQNIETPPIQDHHYSGYIAEITAAAEKKKKLIEDARAELVGPVTSKRAPKREKKEMRRSLRKERKKKYKEDQKRKKEEMDEYGYYSMDEEERYGMADEDDGEDKLTFEELDEMYREPELDETARFKPGEWQPPKHVPLPKPPKVTVEEYQFPARYKKIIRFKAHEAQWLVRRKNRFLEKLEDTELKKFAPQITNWVVNATRTRMMSLWGMTTFAKPRNTFQTDLKEMKARLRMIEVCRLGSKK